MESRHLEGLGLMELIAIEQDCHLYREFLNSLEPQIEVILEEWQNAQIRQIHQIVDSQQEDDYSVAYIEDFSARQQFKGVLTNTFFAGAYALFEYHLYQICELAKQRHGNPLSARDLSGSSLDRAKNYLKKLDGSFPTHTEEWPRIRMYSRVRNNILHAGGYIRGGNSEFDRFVEKHGIVSYELISGPSINLTPEFCRTALDDFEQLLTEANQANLQRNVEGSE